MKLSLKSIRAVNRFERAVREEEMAGAAHPDERPAIEREYADARLALFSIIHNMESRR